MYFQHLDWVEVQSMLSTQRTRYMKVRDDECALKNNPEVLLQKRMLTENGIADFDDILEQVYEH